MNEEKKDDKILVEDSSPKEESVIQEKPKEEEFDYDTFLAENFNVDTLDIDFENCKVKDILVPFWKENFGKNKIVEWEKFIEK